MASIRATAARKSPRGRRGAGEFSAKGHPLPGTTAGNLCESAGVVNRLVRPHKVTGHLEPNALCRVEYFEGSFGNSQNRFLLFVDCGALNLGAASFYASPRPTLPRLPELAREGARPALKPMWCRLATRCQANDIDSLPPLRMRAQLTSGSPVSTIIFFLDDISSIAEKPSLECVLSCRGRCVICRWVC